MSPASGSFPALARLLSPLSARRWVSRGRSLARPRAQRLFTVPVGTSRIAGGLGHGVALHVHQDERGALVGGQGAQRAQEFAVQILALGRGRGGLVRLQELFQPLGVVHRGGLAGGGLAGAVQAGIDRDAVQPGRDGRLAAEGVGGAVGGDQSVLDGVSGLLAVPQGAQCHRPEPVAVPPHELAEGVGIALDMAGEEILIARVAESGVVRHRTPSPFGGAQLVNSRR